jgi:agmatine deiminase
MITDSQTNYLFLADTLPKEYPEFYSRFQKLLLTENINYSLLPGTKAVWAVDYMPVQIDENKFVQFVYKPDYLKEPEDIATISDTNAICQAIGIECIRSGLVIDGGNVLRGNDVVIMCDKVFKENISISKNALEKQLTDIFQVDKLVIIPTDPSDEIGHADGVVRFFDDNTVLINTYPGKSAKERSFQVNLKKSLTNARLNYIEIPCNPYGNAYVFEANGIYMNYLQMEGVIILPVFNIKEDEHAVKKFEEIFAGQTIKTIESNAVAKDGGILNCITWNIKK